MPTPELHFGANLAGENVAEQAQQLEDIGYEYCGAGEHFMRGNPPTPTTMGLPILAAAAGATQNIRVVSTVLLTPLYHPVLLAKLTSTVDNVSQGRLTVGVGVGGEFAAEFEAMGIPVKERGARTNECLALLKRLWTEEHVTHAGRFYPLNDVTLKPPPYQTPHPPIWVAGRRGAAIRRTARYGDGWLPYFYSPEQYKGSVGRITEMAQEEGRDLSGFQWAHYAFISIYDSREEAARIAADRLGGRYSSRADMVSLVGSYCILGSVKECIKRMEEYVEAGVRIFLFAWICPPQDVQRHMEVVAKEIIPYFRG